MADTERNLEHHLFERPLPHCPRCASTELFPVSRDDKVDYVCRCCTARWHVELGAYWRIEPPAEDADAG